VEPGENCDDGTTPADCAPDLATSSRHCGSCGHDCIGGACVGGACQPVVIGVAPGGFHPTHLAIDLTHAYMGLADATFAIGRVPLSGGVVEILAPSDNPEGIAVDATHVYWSNSGYDPPGSSNGTVMKAPLAGGAPTPIATGLQKPRMVALNASHVYWTTFYAHTVMRATKDGLDVVTIAQTGSGPFGIALDSQFVYWTEKSLTASIKKAPIDGGAAVLVALATPVPSGIAVDADRAYWTDIVGDKVESASLAGGVVTEHASGFAGGNGGLIALDATHIYWTNGQAVLRVAKSGGAPEVFAANQTGALGIAVDDKAVYWTNSFSDTIMKRVKN
jgi:hypothetical protein